MKKFKILIYIVVITIIGLISFIIFKNINNSQNKNQEGKEIAEIKYIEVRLVDLLNAMNNIETRNYSISSSKISKQTTSSEGENSTESGGTQDSSNSQDNKSSGGTQSSKSNATPILNSSENSENKQYILKNNGILTNKENINWDVVKSQIENLYLSIPTMTIDLYNKNLNQDDILSFNKEYDNLTMVVKDEKKKETLEELSKVYEFLPKFLQGEDEKYKTVVETKSNVIKAYTKLESENWDDISNDIKNAINIYSKLLTDPNIEKNKQYNINKGYIMLNEMQNAVNMKDKSIFLIKYKNLLEEMENI